ncbi:MAG: TRAP transporter substrate-binding protein DctP [Pseudomonadota bacterium]
MLLTPSLLPLLLALLVLPVAASAQTTLRYSDHEPLGGMRTRFIKDVFFAAIEKESNGRIKIDDHWDSKVSTGYDALRTAGEGKATDMAIVVPEYSAKDLPLHQLFKGFPTGPSGSRQVAFFQRAYAEVPALPTELQKNNVVPVFLATGYPVAFFSTTPLDGLKDLKGRSWRSASFWHQDFLRNSQARPVSMPWGEGVFKAMRDKTLDGLMVNVDSAVMLKVPEVAPNVLLSRDLWLGHLYVVAMNQGTWNALAQQDRDAIQRAATTAYAQLGRVMDESYATMVADLRKAGLQLRELNRAELAAWSATTDHRAVQTAWANDQQAKGVKDAVPVLKKLTELVDHAAAAARGGQ